MFSAISFPTLKKNSLLGPISVFFQTPLFFKGAFLIGPGVPALVRENWRKARGSQETVWCTEVTMAEKRGSGLCGHLGSFGVR